MAVTWLPELPADVWSLSDWLEKIALEKPGGSGAHSLQSSDENIVTQIYANKVRSALAGLLGWAWADDGPPYLLHRENVAVQHPTMPWLWVDGVAVTPHIPLGQTQPTGPVRPKTPGVGYTGYAPTDTTRYTLCDLHVRFRGVQWRMWPDWDPIWQLRYVGKEWMRSFGNTTKSTALDLLSAEGAGDDASLYFADDSSAYGINSGPNGTAFNGTQYVRQQKTTFKMVWKNVPLNYTCGEIKFNEDDISSFLMPYPERLIQAIGYVNSVPFPGINSPYVGGTLLLTQVEEIPYQQPVRTDSEFGLMAADYVLTFEHFDPPRDPNAVPNYGTLGSSSRVVARGHNLVASRTSRYWYLVTAGTTTTRGTYDGRRLLPSYDFHSLFRHRSNTDYPMPSGA